MNIIVVGSGPAGVSVAKGLLEHQAKSKRSAKYIRDFQSFELVYSETYPTRQLAMKREWQLKQFSRTQKDTLINKR